MQRFNRHLSVWIWSSVILGFLVIANRAEPFLPEICATPLPGPAEAFGYNGRAVWNEPGVSLGWFGDKEFFVHTHQELKRCYEYVPQNQFCAIVTTNSHAHEVIAWVEGDSAVHRSPISDVFLAVHPEFASAGLDWSDLVSACRFNVDLRVGLPKAMPDGRFTAFE